MKRKIYLAVAIAIFLVHPVWADDPVYFADAKLKALVETTLGVTDPNATDMLGLTHLMVYYEGVTDLTGLEHATNMTYLRVEGNPVTDVSPLAGLTKMNSLNLSRNQLTDVSSLSGMTKLTKLSFTNNSVSDISALSGMSELIDLYISHNQITDISPLTGLASLEEIGMDSNPVADISALWGMTEVWFLSIGWTNINDISSVSSMTGLSVLYADNARIDDVSPLVGSTSLERVYLGRNQITDISPLAGLIQLTTLELNDNQISNIAALAGYTHLNSLPLDDNPLDNEAYGTYLPLIIANNRGIDITYSANDTPPANVSASDGDYPDRVRLRWNSVYNVGLHVTYRIYRSESEYGEKVWLGQKYNTTFDDMTAIPDVTYYYWIYAVTTSSDGRSHTTPASQCDEGWCSSSAIAHNLVVSSTVGGSVTVPGEGTYHYPSGTGVAITASASTGYEFSGWGGTAVTAGKVADAGASSTTVTVDGDYTVIANFSARRSLSISSSVGGSVTTPGEGTFTYDLGTDVTIAAEPDAGYQFTNWSGTAVTAGKVANPNAPLSSVTLDADYTLTANFMETPPDVRVLTVSSTQGGSVTSPGEGSFTYDPNSVVTIQAVADSSYEFTGWSGTAVSAGKVASVSSAMTTVLLDADYTLRANFQGMPRTLTIASRTGGSVTTPGQGTFTYQHGQVVKIEAQADSGYEFTGWSGDFIGSSNPAYIEINADQSITANFIPTPSVLTVSSGQGGRVVVPGEGAFTYAPDWAVRAVALPEAGFVFGSWTGSLVESGAVAEPDVGRVDCLLEGDATLCANFVPASRSLYVDDNASADPSPDDPLLGDPDEDGSWDHPFDSIQEAIEAAQAGQTVLVLPGTYREHLTFNGKDLMVSAKDLGVAGAVSQTVLTGVETDSVVAFEQDESAGAILSGFTICRGGGQTGGGIRCCGADPTIANCLIVGNRAELGAGLYALDSQATLVNCTIADNIASLEGGGLYCNNSVAVVNSIIYGNQADQFVASDPCQVPDVTYSLVQGGWPGLGNLDADPCFVQPGSWMDAETWTAGDYHLKSTTGYWDGQAWVVDNSASPCIDVGQPNTEPGHEPTPNGKTLNLGAFGGTAEASLTPAGPALPGGAEDFETGNLNRLDWALSGNVPWSVVSEVSYLGAYCAQAGAIEGNQNSTLSITLDCLAGDVSFYCKISSEQGFDALHFYIDGKRQKAWSGEQDWTEATFPVAAGPHTFAWTYTKDSSVSQGQDTAWIDDIMFPVE